MHRRLSLLLWPLLILLAVLPASAKDEPAAPAAVISEATQECLDCHESDTPGIVADWRRSRHARMTPAAALALPPVERRFSAQQVPEEMREVVVGCFECHGLNPGRHKDNFEHNDYRINVVVSPNDCSTCHPVEAQQYAVSKKAHAVDNLEKNPLYHQLVETSIANRKVVKGKVVMGKASENTKGETCYACHGTRIEVRGMKTIVSAEGDEVEVPDLTNWPNQGVGRINPDGSRGACAACHARHGFSIEMARKPYTCSQCHLAPDVPAWEIYQESKHGNIFLSEQQQWDWDHVPWRAGKDYRAPTCATCHNSTLATVDGEVIIERNHDFGARLWVRIFGLIYSHPQPNEGRTYIMRNKDGQPLPTTFDREPATDFLIDEKEQQRRLALMKRVCQQCHGTDWANGHFEQLAHTINETDDMVAAATALMREAWDKGLADPANPFDEPLERKWVEQWLFYANSVRYAAAMGGPDYASFKYGWWELTENLAEMEETVRKKDK